MMNKSEDNLIAVVGPRKAPIVVRLNDFNGRKTIDFRRYFYGTDAADLLPTQKGVSFDREAFAIVQSALNDNSEVIGDWLASTSGQTMEANAGAVAQLQSVLRPHVSEVGDWKSPMFFHVGAHGAVDHLTVNSSHALNKVLELLKSRLDQKEAEHIDALLSGILISYYRAKMLFDGVGEMSPEDMFETLELNWGIILERYAAKVVRELERE